MRIAFASCFHSNVFPIQPVWDWIRAKKPDHLVLLGDSIYLDVNAGGAHPDSLSDDEFAKRLFRLYTAQMQQPAFNQLIQSMPNNRVWSIWDDHDFLWNDAAGAAIARNPVHTGKIRLTTAFQEVFRASLAQSFANGSYPSVYNHGAFWDLNQPALTTPSVQLGKNVWLHLSDCRTHRTETVFVEESKRHLLGSVQRTLFASRISSSASDAVHLFASGSEVSSSYKKRFPTDWRWLLEMAASHRTLVLSGDIHRNETDSFFTGGFPLHEATSSGAAVKDTVVIGEDRRNFGIVDVKKNSVSYAVYANNVEETKWSRKLARSSWIPI